MKVRAILHTKLQKRLNYPPIPALYLEFYRKKCVRTIMHGKSIFKFLRWQQTSGYTHITAHNEDTFQKLDISNSLSKD